MKDFLHFSKIHDNLSAFESDILNNLSEHQVLEQTLNNLKFLMEYLSKGDDTLSFLCKQHEIYAPLDLIEQLLSAQFKVEVLNKCWTSEARPLLENIKQYRQLITEKNIKGTDLVRDFFQAIFAPAELKSPWAKMIDSIVKSEALPFSDKLHIIDAKLPVEDQKNIWVLHQICHKLLNSKLCEKTAIHFTLGQLAKQQFPFRGTPSITSREALMRKNICHPFLKAQSGNVWDNLKLKDGKLVPEIIETKEIDSKIETKKPEIFIKSDPVNSLQPKMQQLSRSYTTGNTSLSTSLPDTYLLASNNVLVKYSHKPKAKSQPVISLESIKIELKQLEESSIHSTHKKKHQKK